MLEMKFIAAEIFPDMSELKDILDDIQDLEINYQWRGHQLLQDVDVEQDWNSVQRSKIAKSPILGSPL